MNLEVNLPILSELLEQIQIVLGKEFVGLYLHGSLALGDFDLVKSDIDFAVVTGNHLEAEMISKLKTYCVISSSKNRADTNPPTLTSFTPQPPTD